MAVLSSTLRGVGYVSVWVIIWGFVGSVIDWPLLQSDIYSVYSLGQAVTFGGTALACIALAIKLAPRWLNSND